MGLQGGLFSLFVGVKLFELAVGPGFHLVREAVGFNSSFLTEIELLQLI